MPTPEFCSMNSLKRLFEALLWNSRLIVLLAVASSVLTGLELFILASVDSARALTSVFTALNPGMTSEVKQALLAENITRFITVIDGYGMLRPGRRHPVAG